MDTISNMITQIKNAGPVGLKHVSMPYSKMRHSIAEVLVKEGFIKSVEVKTRGAKKDLTLELLFKDMRLPTGRLAPVIMGVKRLSKPSRRIYKKFSEIKPVKNNYGALIISTSQGVMTGRDAKRQKLGGEALFTIW